MIFVRWEGGTTRTKLGLLVRLNVVVSEDFDGRIELEIVVVKDSFVMVIVEVVKIESNIVSCTRRVNGNSPRLQNKPV